MGVTNFDAVQAGVFIGPPFPSQGKTYFVKPRTGNDDQAGASPRTALKTLVRALALCKADQNDTVYLMAESNTAGSTTDYQAATLDWNKNGVHLIGCNAGSLFSPRSRVAFASNYVTASNLFTLSASGCLIQGLEFWAGVVDVNPTGCFKLSGTRNVIRRCHIAGMAGLAANGTSSNDIASAYSLQFTGAEENLLEDCTIGQDTVQLGAGVTNAVIYMAAASRRNVIRDSRVLLYTSHATNTQFLRAPANSMSSFLLLDDVLFINSLDQGSTLLTQAFTVVANGGGVMLAGKTSVQGATDWNATDSGNVTAMGYSVTSATAGLAIDVTRA